MLKPIILFVSFVFFACQQAYPACPKCSDCPLNIDTSYSNNNSNESKQNKIDNYIWFVTHVTDGDTLIVKQNLIFYPSRQETIRLLNINTPEKGEPLYNEAATALKEFVKGGDITLQYSTPSIETRGKYGRLLAYIFVENKNINIEMVRLGFSIYWIKYGESRFDKEFKEAEQEAKLHKRGIWK